MPQIRNPPEPRKLNELPVDIILLLFKQCDIDTLFSSRLICKLMNAIIQEHIKVIAPAVASNTFPFYAACHLSPASPDGYTLGWLRDLVPNQLSSIVLDKDKLRQFFYLKRGYLYGIPAESDCAEARQVRTVMATGWRVLRRFSQISKEIYSLSERDLKKHNRDCGLLRRLGSLLKAPQVEPLDVNQQREEIILQHRINLLKTLSITEIIAFNDLTRILQCCFRPYCNPFIRSAEAQMQWDEQTRQHGTVINWTQMLGDQMFETSWLYWFILSNGPTPFLDQWCSNRTVDQRQNIIRDQIWREYSARELEQYYMESRYASDLEYHLEQQYISHIARMENLGLHFFNPDPRSIFSISNTSFYDQSLVLAQTSPMNFPWYDPSKPLWVCDDWFMILRVPSTDPQVVWDIELDWPDVGQDDGKWDKGPLENVPYLCYLGVLRSESVWPKPVPMGSSRRYFEF